MTSVNIEKYIGKLVVVAHWPEYDLDNVVAVGCLEKYEDGYFYIFGDWRGWRYCRVVSKRVLQKENIKV